MYQGHHGRGVPLNLVYRPQPPHSRNASNNEYEEQENSSLLLYLTVNVFTYASSSKRMSLSVTGQTMALSRLVSCAGLALLSACL